MSLATKNVATVLVGSVLVLALSFAFVTPAKADMLSDLQAQVQALLAQIAALGGGSTTTSGAGCYAFTQSHQQGQSGGEIMWIQKFLNSHGAQVAASGAGSPGNETAYFGAMTKAAVAKFQAANGITPAAGYWGPITIAKAKSLCASAPTTGTPSTGGESLSGSAGSISLNSYSADVEDDVYTGETEKVLGFRVEASGGDVRVTNTRVKFTYTGASTGSDRLGNYASEISVWANGQKIAAMSPSSFVRDSAGVYSASIPVSQVVRMGSNNKVTFNIGFTANASVDTDDVSKAWTAELVQTRYTDASGATLFDSTSVSNAGVNVKRLSSSSDVKLRIAEGSGNPKAGNVKVSTTGTTEITLAEFTLKAEGAEMEFDTLKATSTITGASTNSDMVQEFYLMRGSTRLADITATSTTSYLEFDLDDTETIAKDATQTYRIVAKVNKTSTGTFDDGDSIKVDVNGGEYYIAAKSTSDGKSVTTRAGSVTTYTQTLYAEGIQVSKVGESFTHNPQDTSANSTGEFKVTLRVTNFGSNDVYVPLSALASTTAGAVGDNSTKGVSYYLYNGTTATSTTVTATLSRVSGGTELTNSVRIGGGSSADFQLAVTYNPDVPASTGQWRVQIGSVGTALTDATAATTLTRTVPAEDFRTGYYTVNN
ncbi:peptidoglycan-binding protein [bacterium]|nr:peptidoglycan-binding protein [bacterium]